MTPGFRPRPAVFLDKDGTLVADVPYNVDPDRMALTSGAGPALRRLADAGYRLIVVSNQPGVAYGYFPRRALRAVDRRLRELLEPFGVALDGVRFCLHRPATPGCDCRKPAPGLLLGAAAELGLDLASSWMVGDILDDVEVGRRVGCRTVFLDVGNEHEWRLAPERLPDHVAPDLAGAAEVIARADAKGRHPAAAARP